MPPAPLLLAAVAGGAAGFCDYRLGLETDPQLGATGSIYTTDRALFRSLGVSPDSAAFANVGHFLADRGQICSCASWADASHTHCYWPSNHSSAWVNCSVERFAGFDDAQIAAQVNRSVASWQPSIGDPEEATFMLFLDVEGPNGYYDPGIWTGEGARGRLCVAMECWWQFSDADFAQLAQGFKRRIDAWRKALPKAKLGFWNTIGPDFGGGCDHYGVSGAEACYAKMVAGAQQMAALGVLDKIDFLSPELYPGPGQNAEVVAELARARLGNASLIRRSDGTRFALVANPSWLTYGSATTQQHYCSPAPGSGEWQCPAEAEFLRTQAEAIQAWNATDGDGMVTSIVYWSGDDSYPNGDQRAKWTAPYTNLTMTEWFKAAVNQHGLVPPECLP